MGRKGTKGGGREGGLLRGREDEGNKERAREWGEEKA